MCGISAIVSNHRYDHDSISAMTEMVKHRGPDSSDYFQSGRVSLGHQRLKIIDLSDNANQPMEYDGCWIVFNGEIYNYKGLRAVLEEHGNVFKTQSDTEVILHLYRESTTIHEFLNQLSGMFAFIIYDERKNRVVIARDRFGIKPIYYMLLPDGYAFASEIKQFTAFPNWKSDVVTYMKDDFLTGGLIDHQYNRTIFKNVFLIEPGTYATLTPVGVMQSHKQWYDLKKAVSARETTSTFLTIQWLLKCSVEQHLQADVPVGSCLSGGIDSTSIVCMVNRIRKNSHKQFTVSARSVAEFDEGGWIDIVEKQCSDIERHDVFPQVEDLFNDLSSVIYHQDSPIPTTSMYAQWKVFEKAKSDVKVMLDGQGSDEIFAGYHMYFGARFASLLRGGHLYTLMNEMNTARKIPGYNQKNVLKYSANSLKNYPSVFDYSYDQVTRTSLPALLHWEDRNSMAHSIEARVPFLDHRLVEYVMALPEEKKISNGTTKVILREAMRGLIPDEIVDRKDKIGFQTPETHWFNQRSDLFSDRYRSIREKLPHTMRVRCDDICKKKKPYSYDLWRAISYGEFCKVFGVVNP